MLFEKDKYYGFINGIEKMITVAYVIFILLGVIIGMTTGGIIGLIIGGLIGLFIATLYTKASKIKIQEMKWKMDIYEMLTDIKKK